MFWEAPPAGAGTQTVLAFDQTQSNGTQFYATLVLFNAAGEAITLTCGSTTCLTTNGAQGSIIDLNPAVPPSLGGGAGGNSSYAAGVYDGNLLADYFLFDLTGVTKQKDDTTTQVYSAELIIYSGTTAANLTLNLTGLTDSTIAGLTTDLVPPLNTALYAGLVSGPSYGSFALPNNTSSPGELLTLTITDPTALAAINQDIVDGTLGFGGNISAAVGTPEPSTWVMMLAGFAGLGFVAHCRSAKRRAAAAG